MHIEGSLEGLILVFEASEKGFVERRGRRIESGECGGEESSGWRRES
jgi:hypothetical protein